MMNDDDSMTVVSNIVLGSLLIIMRLHLHVGIFIVAMSALFVGIDASCAQCTDQSHFYVKIQKQTAASECPYGDEIINLGEIVVYSNGKLLANSKIASTASSIYNAAAVFPPEYCNDNDPSTFCSTAFCDVDAWFLLDTGTTQIDTVVVKNRVDCCGFRINTASITFYYGSNLYYSSTFSSVGLSLSSYTFNNAVNVITTIAGTGSVGYSGDAGQAASATLNSPSGIDIDSSGNVIFADALNHRVRMITVSTGIITTIAGIDTDGFSGDGGQASSAALNWPCGLFIDTSGNAIKA